MHAILLQINRKYHSLTKREKENEELNLCVFVTFHFFT